MASGTRDGDWVQASVLLLPAAIPYCTPDAIERWVASSRAGSASPPRLMLATAGFTAFAVTQSTPATTCAVVPEPLQFRTRTAHSVTFFAIPNVLPPTVPA